MELKFNKIAAKEGQKIIGNNLLQTTKDRKMGLKVDIDALVYDLMLWELVFTYSCAYL